MPEVSRRRLDGTACGIGDNGVKLTIVDGGGGGDGDRPQDRPRTGPCRITADGRIAPFAIDRQALDEMAASIEAMADRLLSVGWTMGVAVHQNGKRHDYGTLAALRLAHHRGRCERITIIVHGSVSGNLEDAPVSAVEAAHIRWHADAPEFMLEADLCSGTDRSRVFCSAPTRRIADLAVDPLLAQIDHRMLDVVVDDVRHETDVEREVDRIRSLFPAPPRPRRSEADLVHARAWSMVAATALCGIVILVIRGDGMARWLPATVMMFLTFVAAVMFRGVALVEHRDRPYDSFSDHVEEALDRVRRQCRLDREIADMKIMCGIPDPSTRASSVIDLGV